jgi:hypothetical protein
MHPRTRRCSTILAATLLAGGSAWAQLNLDAPVIREQPPAAVPATAQSAPAPGAAERMMEDLLRQHGNGSPNGVSPTAPDTPAPVLARPLEMSPEGLIREGQLIQGRTGRIRREEASGATLVIPENPSGAAHLATMAAVPSRMLELMENAAGFSDPKNSLDLVFPIDAEVTQYRGKNYLFLEKPATLVRLPASTTPATMPHTIAGVLPQPKIEPVAPNAPEVKEVTPGFEDLVKERVGRLVKDIRTGAEIIVFDGDGKRMLDQPMGLIPCKFLEVMEDASEFGMKPVKFKVSGQITPYRGKNFLLLRSVSIVRDTHGGIGG